MSPTEVTTAVDEAVGQAKDVMSIPEITHQAAEVAWGGWMTPAELSDRLADPSWSFVPDGRQLVETLLADGRL